MSQYSASGNSVQGSSSVGLSNDSFLRQLMQVAQSQQSTNVGVGAGTGGASAGGAGGGSWAPFRNEFIPPSSGPGPMSGPVPQQPINVLPPIVVTPTPHIQHQSSSADISNHSLVPYQQPTAAASTSASTSASQSVPLPLEVQHQIAALQAQVRDLQQQQQQQHQGSTGGMVAAAAGVGGGATNQLIVTEPSTSLLDTETITRIQFLYRELRKIKKDITSLSAELKRKREDFKRINAELMDKMKTNHLPEVQMGHTVIEHKVISRSAPLNRTTLRNLLRDYFRDRNDISDDCFEFIIKYLQENGRSQEVLKLQNMLRGGGGGGGGGGAGSS